MGHCLGLLGLLILTEMEGKLNKSTMMLKNLSVSPAPVSSLTGIQFGDNGGQNFVTKQNGVAVATTQVRHILEIKN